MRRASVTGSPRGPGFALLAGLLLATSACGVPEDDRPRALERSAAPFQLFDQSPEPTRPPSDLQSELYFVLVDRLAATTRPVPQPGSAEQVTLELFEGPTELERTSGLSSAIPSVFSLQDVDVRNRIAVVSLDGIDESVRTDQVTAFAQIVATLDALPDIDGVRFRTGDLDLPVPSGDGSSTDEPLDRDDYPVLLDEAPTVEPAGAASVQPAPVPAATPTSAAPGASVPVPASPPAP